MNNTSRLALLYLLATLALLAIAAWEFAGALGKGRSAASLAREHAVAGANVPSPSFSETRAPQPGERRDASRTAAGIEMSEKPDRSWESSVHAERPPASPLSGGNSPEQTVCPPEPASPGAVFELGAGISNDRETSPSITQSPAPTQQAP